jgi:hypothetical protein
MKYALVALGVVALFAAKFLWGFTLWYEWIALGVAFVLLYAGGVFGFDKRRGSGGERRSDGN